MELLNQMDGFSKDTETSLVKTVMATNRPDILDPALLRPGRLDRKIEIPEPNESQRMEILKIHSKSITTKVSPNPFPCPFYSWWGQGYRSPVAHVVNVAHVVASGGH